MSLADALDLASNNPGDQRRITRIDRIMEQLNDVDGAAFMAALKDPTYSTVQLSIVMGREGYPVSEASIQRWRKHNA